MTCTCLSKYLILNHFPPELSRRRHSPEDKCRVRQAYLCLCLLVHAKLLRMLDTGAFPSVYRFGTFELDPRTGELRKRGVRVKLQDQPLHVLVLLLERSGELVTREQIQNKLWPPGTYVDYDNAINSAVRKLRDALGDVAENPRFIETFARRGYRFIGTIENPRQVGESAPLPAAPILPTLDKRKMAPILLLGAAVLIIVSVAGWWHLRPRSPSSHLQLKSVPLTAAGGWESEPSFSPDANQVAYAWDEGAGPQLRRHIFVKSIGGGNPLKLTSSANEDRSPAWSPNGRSIAFIRVFNSGRGLYTIPALGGAERQVAKGYFAVKDLFARAISWSPDGRFLAVAESNQPDASTFLSLVNVETGERLRLTTTPGAATSDFNPAFSPDGRRLLFTRCAENCELYVLPLSQDSRSAGPPSSLKQVGQDIKGNAWMPDGKEIVYSVYKADWEASLMKVRAEPGAPPERLPFTDELPFSPFSVAVAPRGDRLAYTAILYFVQIWKVEPGKAPESFAPSTRWDVNPQYSPDGQQVVFVSNRSGVVQIWSCDSHGGNPLQITHFDSGFSGSPRWSPDGRSVAFDRRLQHGWAFL